VFNIFSCEGIKASTSLSYLTFHLFNLSCKFEKHRDRIRVADVTKKLAAIWPANSSRQSVSIKAWTLVQNRD